jgi:hypothetical protein
MNFNVTVAVIIIIGVIVSVSLIYYETAGHSPVGSTVAYSAAIQSGMNVQFVSNNLTVGFQSGLWQMSLKNVGTVSVSKMTVFLNTPVGSYVCSGVDQSAALSFSNCTVAPSGNPLPSGTTISGSASGIGEGSGKVGSTYGVAARVLFSNGDTVWINSTVTATTPTG